MKLRSLITIGALTTLSPNPLVAQDLAGELKGLVGYTVVMADTVDKVATVDGDKFLRLSGGRVFKVQFLLLDPLPLTNVIVLAKVPPKAIVDKAGGRIPEEFLTSYKLVIGNKVYDSRLHRSSAPPVEKGDDDDIITVAETRNAIVAIQRYKDLTTAGTPLLNGPSKFHSATRSRECAPQ